MNSDIVTFHSSGHTTRDAVLIAAGGRNPTLTQHREHPVRCRMCQTSTMHLAGYCDTHYREP